MRRKVVRVIAALALVVMTAGFSACQKASPTSAQSNLTYDHLQENYREQVSFTIAEATIADGKAVATVTLPDLNKIFEEVFAQHPDAGEEVIVRELQSSLGKYSVEKAVEAPVEQVEGQWQLQSYEPISAAIDESFNDFIMQQLAQAVLEMEVAK